MAIVTRVALVTGRLARITFFWASLGVFEHVDIFGDAYSLSVVGKHLELGVKYIKCVESSAALLKVVQELICSDDGVESFGIF